MKCPSRSAEMASGTANVAWPTAVGVLEFAGILFGDSPGSQQYLYFYPSGGGDSVRVFEGTRTAYRCPKCQLVAVAGTGTA